MSLLPFMMPVEEAGGGRTLESVTQPSTCYLDDLSAQAVASNFTIAFRFAPLDLSVRKFILGNYGDIYLRVETDGDLSWKCEDEFGTAHVSGSSTSQPITATNWHNVLCHFDYNGGSDLYVDGASVKTDSSVTANDLNTDITTLFHRPGGSQEMEADWDFVWCNWGDALTTSMTTLYDALFTGEDASANTAIHGDNADEVGTFDSMAAGFYLWGSVAEWNGVGTTPSPVGTATKTGSFT